METPEKILICDDLNENLQILARILIENGYEVSLARHANEMMDLLADYFPNLILLDVMMPDINGFEACRSLKLDSRYKDIPVIFITAKIETDDIVEGFQSGGVDYITKPFKASEMLVRVRNHLDLQKSKKTIENQSIELQKLNHTKDQIFSIISHDMRTPLASLKMLLQVLQKVDICEKQDFVRETLCLIDASADETYQLLDNLLIWSKSQMGRLTVSPVRFSLVNVVNNTLKLFSFAISNKNLKIAFDAQQPYMLVADEEMIKTVIRNILSNAIKFSPMGETISISIQSLEKELIVSILNKGKEMSEEISSKIFLDNEFITTPGTKGEKGNGLGMKICKKFIDLNHGSIGVNCTKGTGTEFYFKLPNNLS